MNYPQFRSDADPDDLAKYVLKWIKSSQSNEHLEKLCLDNLSAYLQARKTIVLFIFYSKVH